MNVLRSEILVSKKIKRGMVIWFVIAIWIICVLIGLIIFIKNETSEDQMNNKYYFIIDDTTSYQLIDHSFVTLYGGNCYTHEESGNISGINMGNFWAGEMSPTTGSGIPIENEWHEARKSIIAIYNYEFQGNVTLYPDVKACIINHFRYDSRYEIKIDLTGVKKINGDNREIELISERLENKYCTGNQYVPLHFGNINSEEIHFSKGDGLSLKIQGGCIEGGFPPTPLDEFFKPEICSDSISKGTFIKIKINPYIFKDNINNDDENDYSFNYHVQIEDKFHTFSKVKMYLKDQDGTLLVDSNSFSFDNEKQVNINTSFDFSKLRNLVVKDIDIDKNIYNLHIIVSEDTSINDETVEYEYMRPIQFQVDYNRSEISLFSPIIFSAISIIIPIIVYTFGLLLNKEKSGK